MLVAIGRTPNSDTLSLESAGVETDGRGFITVDDTARTTVPHIYAIGDVNSRGAFTHTSVHDGQVLTDRLFSNHGEQIGRRISDRTPVHAVCIDPPLARVGLSEREARGSGKNVLLASRDMINVNRAREKSETHGKIKLFVDGDTQQILGATVFGVGGDEIVGVPALAIHTQLPYAALQQTVLPHPTVSELIPWFLQDLGPLDG